MRVEQFKVALHYQILQIYNNKRRHILHKIHLQQEFKQREFYFFKSDERGIKYSDNNSLSDYQNARFRETD